MTKQQFIEAVVAEGVYAIEPDGSIYGRFGKKLTPHINSKGYSIVTLHYEGEMQSVRVHRLVAAKFYGPSPLQVNHKDLNKLNNHKDNLEYVTGAANKQHYWRTAKAYTPGRVKLSFPLAEQLREEYSAGGISQRKLATKYGLCDLKHLRDVLRGKAWSPWL